MRENQKTIVIVIAVLLILGIAAVILLGGNKGSGTAALKPEIVKEGPSDTLAPENTQIVESVDIEDTPIVGDSGEEKAALPTPRGGLESTNPASVKIASGNIQLIEFFAFW